jgi:hypothetical protein
LNDVERREPEKYLVLLSWYGVEAKEEAKVDSAVRWHTIANVLSRTLRGLPNKTSAFVIQQFLGFLKDKGMTMEKVTWELSTGIHSLMSLMNMLGEAVKAAKVREKSGGVGIEYYGRLFTVGQTVCWSGIYYSKPHTVRFDAYDLTEAKAEKAKATGLGEVQKQSKATFKWITELDLDSEEIHFFALSLEHQQSRIEDFIVKSVATVKEITATL